MASRGSEFEAAPAEGTEEDRLVRYGTSMFGGRPTFTLVRRETDGGGEWTLHELLPREQAEARRDRLERDGRSLKYHSSRGISFRMSPAMTSSQTRRLDVG